MTKEYSDEAPEPICDEIRKRHGLTGFHIFADGDVWRVFGFRNDPRGYQASVEQGRGATIAACLKDLDDNLIAGPIAAARARAEGRAP